MAKCECGFVRRRYPEMDDKQLEKAVSHLHGCGLTIKWYYSS